VEDRPKAATRVGQLVDGGRGRRRQLVPGDQARGLEILEPGGEDVGADPGQALDEIGVALGAVHELPGDEKCPALADEAQCAGDRAVLVVALHVKIILQDDLRFASICFSVASEPC
jgi:hypothetical protein